MAFPVKEDGTLGAGKQMHDATADVKASPNKGLPDGLKVDQKGNVFATAVNGVYVFAPDGKLLGRIVTNDKTANCAFGDDGTTLYMTVNDKLARVKTATRGLGSKSEELATESQRTQRTHRENSVFPRCVLCDSVPL